MTRDKKLSLRLTEEEDQIIRLGAEKAGMSVSQYIVFLSKKRRIYSKESTVGFVGNLAFLSEQLQNMNLEFSKCGRNINTVTRFVNSNNYISKKDFSQYLQYLKEYNYLLEANTKLSDELKNSLRNIFDFLSGRDSFEKELEEYDYILSLITEAKDAIETLRKKRED